MGRLGGWCAIAVACGDPRTAVIEEAQTWKSFPFDGVRTWTYVNADRSVPYAIVATSDGVAERRVGPGAHGFDVYTVSYGCVGESEACATPELYALQWSSDTFQGVFVHGVRMGGAATFVAFDPPLWFAGDTQAVGERLVTETNGATWTSTRGESQGCDDLVWELETADGGYPLAGQWWAMEVVGVTAFQRSGDATRWELAEIACEEDCDGAW